MNIYIINGPNLEILAYRESNIYGNNDLAQIENYCQELEATDSINMTWLQSSSESKLLEFIHDAIRKKVEGIIINPAAFCHTSIAILDALNAYEGFVIEVHLSNVHKRELFRQTRITAKRADAVIEGLGKESYRVAINAMKNKLLNQ